MSNFIPLLALVLVGIVCAYLRAGLRTWTIASAAALVVAAIGSDAHWAAIAVTALVFAGLAVPLNHTPTRRRYVVEPALAMYAKMIPQLSETERVALEAGTVGWEGELFSGRPQWNRLLEQRPATLSEEERAFIDGPTEELCAMVNDWEVSHERADLSPETWEFIKKHRFFGMIIPKQYGG